jgi:hypothetical protein
MARKKTELPVLSHQRREDLNRQIAQERADKAQLTGTPGNDDLPEAHLPVTEVADIDVGAVDRRIGRTQRALEMLGPGSRKLTGAQRQGAEAEWKHLKEWLQERMDTKQHLGAYPSATDSVKQAVYEEALRKAMDFTNGEHSPAFVQAASKWQNLGRLLWPDDPDQSNLEKIRPEGSKSGRHFNV